MSHIWRELSIIAEILLQNLVMLKNIELLFLWVRTYTLQEHGMAHIIKIYRFEYVGYGVPKKNKLFFFFALSHHMLFILHFICILHIAHAVDFLEHMPNQN